MEEKNDGFTRRDFVKIAGTALAGFTILPSGVVAGLGHRAPTDKLNIGVVGVGGVGFRNLNHLSNENIVAMCDVDWSYAEKSFRRWNDARRYKDFRVMLEKEKNLDAIVIATPDHTHSVIAMAAMQLQKHVYVQAPMAHAVFEARRMTETARVYNVVSQVGNQVASSEGTRLFSEIFWSGAIGEVREVHAWTPHPLWKQGADLTVSRGRVPRDLDWDLFVGPARAEAYHQAYHPFTWRAWWRFGNGAAGSMMPHLLEPVFRALMLNAPASVEASSSVLSLDFAPAASKVVYNFNRRDNLPKVGMPAVKLHWYDGGLLPEWPSDISNNEQISDASGGLFMIGADGTLLYNYQTDKVRVFRKGVEVEVNTERKLHRIADAFTGGHEKDFMRACKESSGNRLPASANFDSQLALTETVLTGNMALRLQSLGKPLLWDSAQMRFTNISESDELIISKIGEVTFDRGIARTTNETVKEPATRFVERTVRPLYRQGWNQI